MPRRARLMLSDLELAVIRAGAARLEPWSTIEAKRAAQAELERQRRLEEWKRRKALPAPPPEPETWGDVEVSHDGGFVKITVVDNEWDSARARMTPDEADSLAKKLQESAHAARGA